MLNSFFICNPLEQFEIIDFIYISAPIFGYLKFSLTNLGFYLLLAFSVLMFFSLSTYGSYFSSKKSNKILANRWNLIIEAFYNSILSLIKVQIGKKGEIYMPFLFTFFTLILIINLLGLIPYSFSPTAHFSLTLSLSIGLIVGLTILGLAKHGLHFFSFFVPAGSPLGLIPLLVLIETVSYIARAFSLGVRLGANLISGHCLLKIISTFSWAFITSSKIAFIIGIIPLGFIFLLMCLELGVACLQAYVISVLCAGYIKDALVLHS